jgi:hypothetical protein
MPQQITFYELNWDTSKNVGSIGIEVEGGDKTMHTPQTPEEWIAIALILSKAPATIDDTGLISTGSRQVGT